MYPRSSRPERRCNTTQGGSSCTVSKSIEESRLRLGFPQPSADFQCFRARLREDMVLLGSCSVKNQSFQKAVGIRITFDSWHSQQDVSCAFLKERYGGPDTDIFEFDITLPMLDEKFKFFVLST